MCIITTGWILAVALASAPLQPVKLTPDLIAAVARDDAATVRIWLDNGGDVNAKGGDGYALIHHTMLDSANALNVARLLIARGTDLKTRYNPEIWELREPLLQFAIEHKRYEILGLLLDSGAPKYLADKDGYYALHYAAYWNDTLACRMLLEHGASLDKLDAQGRTALQVAWNEKSAYIPPQMDCMRIGNEEPDTTKPSEDAYSWTATTTFIFLLKRGANADWLNWNCFEPLQRATQFNVPELVYEQARHGVTVAKLDSAGETGLHKAAKFGSIEVARFLLEKGAKVDARNSYKVTPLLYAALGKARSRHTWEDQSDKSFHRLMPENNFVTIARLLIERGADINAEHDSALFFYLEKHESVLTAAAASNSTPIIEMLLEHGLSVNLGLGHRKTALKVALRHGSVEAVRLLLDRGADLSVVNTACADDLEQIVLQDDATDITEKMLDAGVPVNGYCNDNWQFLHPNLRSLLQIAVYYSCNSQAELLLRRGAIVDSLDLLYAVQNRSFRLVNNLLQVGANAKFYNVLTLAVSNGSTEIVEALIKAGAHLNYDVFSTAITSGDSATVSYLTAKIPNSARQEFLDKGFYLAASNVKLDAMVILARNGADVNRLGYGGITPLIQACQKNWVEEARLLVKEGGDVKPYERGGWSALTAAAVNVKDNGLFRSILQLGGNPNDVVPSVLVNRIPVLQEALSRGDSIKARLLAEYGAEINGNSLIASILSGNEVLTLCLIGEAVRPDRHWFGKHLEMSEILGHTGEGYAYTPLHFAASQGQSEAARKLLNAGADVNAQDKYGSTPLVWAALPEDTLDWLRKPKGDRLNVARVLLEHGANPNLLTLPNNPIGKRGQPLIHLAVRYHSLDYLKLLIDHGVNLDAPDEESNTPLHQAVISGRLEMVSALIEAGAKVNVINGKSQTPLQLAIKGNRKKIADMLRKAGG